MAVIDVLWLIVKVNTGEMNTLESEYYLWYKAAFLNKDYTKWAHKHLDRGWVTPAKVRLSSHDDRLFVCTIGLFANAWFSCPVDRGRNLHLVDLASSGFTIQLIITSSIPIGIVCVASSLVVKTYVRSMWSGFASHFTIWMHYRLDYRWTTTLKACISLEFCAISYLFFFLRARERKKGKDPNAHIHLCKMD